MKTVYIESALQQHPRVADIVSRYPKANRIDCQHFGEVFNKKTQNFRLQKQLGPSWILAEKTGKRVLPTPESFGIGGVENYYFSHFLNCLYDCRYCFLQGMYQSANYVWFVNYEDFQRDIRSICQQDPNKQYYFFSGYDGDSLALEPVTHFVREFVPFFETLSNAFLELRTKSVQIRELLKQPVNQCVIVAFSLTPQAISSAYEKGVPDVADRLKAMQQLAKCGWPIGLRLDPLIDCTEFEQYYDDLIEQIFAVLSANAIHSISIGPLRFPKKMFDRIASLYPDSKLFSQPFEKQQGHMSYRAEREQQMRQYVERKLLQYVSGDKLFRCSVI